MVAERLALHMTNAHVAMTIIRGYQLLRVSAQIPRFPEPNRNSAEEEQS